MSPGDYSGRNRSLERSPWPAPQILLFPCGRALPRSAGVASEAAFSLVFIQTVPVLFTDPVCDLWPKSTIPESLQNDTTMAGLNKTGTDPEASKLIHTRQPLLEGLVPTLCHAVFWLLVSQVDLYNLPLD